MRASSPARPPSLLTLRSKVVAAMLSPEEVRLGLLSAGLSTPRRLHRQGARSRRPGRRLHEPTEFDIKFWTRDRAGRAEYRHFGELRPPSTSTSATRKPPRRSRPWRASDSRRAATSLSGGGPRRQSGAFPSGPTAHSQRSSSSLSPPNEKLRKRRGAAQSVLADGQQFIAHGIHPRDAGALHLARRRAGRDQA